MKQLKALLIKEWQTHRITFLVPLWCTLGVYAVGIIGYLLSLIKGNTMNFISLGDKVSSGMGNLLIYGSIYGTVATLGTVAIITAIILSDSMINGGFKRKCEILHLSQTVSLIKIIGVKYLILTLGVMLQFALVGLVNTLLLSAVQVYFTSASFYFGLIAWAQATVELSLSLLFLASLYWFFAGVFKRKSFLFGSLTILSIQAAISVLNYTAGLHIPSLIEYLARLATVQANVNLSPQSLDVIGIMDLVANKWQDLKSWDTIMKFIYSAVFFVGGFYLFKRKELS